VNISYEKPPIFEEAEKLFGVTEKDPVFYTFADTCYIPSGIPITADLIAHEETHAEQQEHDPLVAKIWWQRYFIDPDFRIEQEAEAYGAQYRFLCRIYRDRNAQARILHGLASHLSGKIYGYCIGLLEASRKIKEYASGEYMKDIEKGLEDTNQIEV